MLSNGPVVEDVLRAKQDALVAGLADLEGTVQLNVKIRHDERALLRTILAVGVPVHAIAHQPRG